MEKLAFFIFGGDFPFSIAFLWSQNSGIGPNIQNLAKNLNFTRSLHLYWPHQEKLGKIRKQCYQTLFHVLTPFSTQDKCKLHSDQVSRHSIGKKYYFGRSFDFSWSHPEMGIIFSINPKVAFLTQKTGSNVFPVANQT